MAVYLVADIDVHDAETYAEYSRLAQATFEGYGEVTYLVRGGEAEALEGDWQRRRRWRATGSPRGSSSSASKTARRR